MKPVDVFEDSLLRLWSADGTLLAEIPATHIPNFAKLAPVAKELEKMLFDGMGPGPAHRGGHGLISAALRKVLVAVAGVADQPTDG